MRAKRLFVLTFGADSSGELRKGAESLAKRMVNHATDGLAYINVFSEENWQVNMETRERKDAFEGIDTEKDIGVYLIGHHGGHVVGIGGFTAENIVAVIGKMGFKHIRKLCLLACFLDEHSKKGPFGAAASLASEAKLKERRAPMLDNPSKVPSVKGLTGQIEEAQKAAQGSYMGKLAKLLAAMGIKPMIAGWDSFVTACYPDHVMLKLATAQANNFQIAENAGRKVVASRSDANSKTFQFASSKGPDEQATKIKKTVVRWEEKPDGGDGLLILDQEGWSDKNRKAIQ